MDSSITLLNPINKSNSSVSRPAPTPSPDPNERFRVVIIDNDHNTYMQVIEICMFALGVNWDQAYHIALAVDHNGEATVLEGDHAEANRTAEVIRTIGIEVRVEPVA